MEHYLKQIKNIFLITKYRSLENIKKLCSLVGFTNVITCVIFYYWLITFRAHATNDSVKNLLIVSALSHIYTNIVLIYWSLSYEGTKWQVWAWLSLIFVSPLGVGLIHQASNQSNWKEIKTAREDTKQSIFHSLANSFVSLPDTLQKSIDYLHKHYPEDFEKFLDKFQLSVDYLNYWDTKRKFLVIAIYESLKQTKKKNTFKDIAFNAHWYDQRYFDFAIRDPKSLIIPNFRYKYALGVIVLDEFNNYQKILDGKKEIKANMKFGPAKTIFLHWGKGFKVYVNE